MSINEQMQVNSIVKQWVNSLMNEDGVSATMVETALTSVLLEVKNQVWIDYLLELQMQNEVPEERGE